MDYGVDDVSILAEIFDVLTFVDVETVHVILGTLVCLNRLSKVYMSEMARLGALPIL